MAGATPVAGLRTQKFLIEPETQYGVTESVVDTKLNALRVAVHPMLDIELWASQGDAVPAMGVVNDNYSELTCTGKLSFSDVTYPLCSIFGLQAPTLLGGIAYQWQFPWDGTEVVSPQSYSITYGDVNRARRIPGIIFNTLAFSIARDGNLEMTSNAFGKAMERGVVSYPRESVFTLTISASGGTYTITWAGQTTSALAYNANAAAILAALVALSNVAVGDLAVTGTGPWTITPSKTGAFEATNVTATMNAGSLTGGSGTLVEAQEGGPINSVAAVPMFPLMFDVYMDDAWEDLGETQIGSIYNLDTGIGERFSRVRPVDSSLDSDGIVEAEGDTSGQPHTFGFTVAADATGEALIDDAENGTVKFFRIEANGATDSIDSGHAYLFRWDFAYLIGEVGEYGSVQGGVHSIPFTGRFAKDQVTGNCSLITLNNKLAGL